MAGLARREMRQLKCCLRPWDLDKMGAATIDLAHLSINPVDKVVWEPMKALNQLDGATGDFIMENNSNDSNPYLKSPISADSRTPPPLCSPLLFCQLPTVPKKTSNDEHQGNDTMGVQGGGADADGVMVGGVGFGIQDDHRELTPFPDAGDLLNAYFSWNQRSRQCTLRHWIQLLAFTRKTLCHACR